MNEYEITIAGVVHTVLLTPETAQRMGARPVGASPQDTAPSSRKRAATSSKARTPRNKAAGSGTAGDE